MDTTRFIIEIVTILGDRGLAAFETGPAGLVVAHVFRTPAAAERFVLADGRPSSEELCAILVPPMSVCRDCGVAS